MTGLGWTIGAGAEIPVWGQWSVKAEYLYVDFGTVTDSFTSPLDFAQFPAQTHHDGDLVQDPRSHCAARAELSFQPGRRA